MLENVRFWVFMPADEEKVLDRQKSKSEPRSEIAFGMSNEFVTQSGRRFWEECSGWMLLKCFDGVHIVHLNEHTPLK